MSIGSAEDCASIDTYLSLYGKRPTVEFSEAEVDNWSSSIAAEERAEKALNDARMLVCCVLSGYSGHYSGMINVRFFLPMAGDGSNSIVYVKHQM